MAAFIHSRTHASGFSLVELMIAMALGLGVVAVVANVYLGTLQSQRSLERQSSATEAGAFALQLLGRDIVNAGTYPAHVPPHLGLNDLTQQGMYDTYPPLQFAVRKLTDWQDSSNAWPPTAYMTGIYGCDGGVFDVATARCPAADAAQPDSLVVNYFTYDATGTINTRKDCTGVLADSDPSNAQRRNAFASANTPPQLPLFVSNRYALQDSGNVVDGQSIGTKSLVCSGNGHNPHATASDYQPIVHGLRDLQLRYGVFGDEDSFSPTQFYSATEISAMATVSVQGQPLSGWQRVVAVQVCVLVQTQGGGVRLADATGAEKTYADCHDREQKQPAGQMVTRWVQTFGVRNVLKQSY